MKRGPKPKPLEARFWPKVQKSLDPDGCWEWSGATVTGYGSIGVAGHKTALAHRVSFEMAYGPIPEDLFVDHICHNHPCVRPDHLRAVTRKQNQENRSGVNRNNTSGFLGVTWNRRICKWQAQVVHARTFYCVGYFDDRHEAAEAARLKRLELYTHNDLDKEEANAA